MAQVLHPKSLCIVLQVNPLTTHKILPHRDNGPPLILSSITCSSIISSIIILIMHVLLFVMFCLNKLSGALLNNITALYKRVEYSLEINDHQAKYFEVKRGVKQGCILSPTLFNIFINDLISFVQELDKGQQLTMARLALICMHTMLSLWLKMNKTYIHVQILIDRVDFGVKRMK